MIIKINQQRVIQAYQVFLVIRVYRELKALKELLVQRVKMDVTEQRFAIFLYILSS